MFHKTAVCSTLILIVCMMCACGDHTQFVSYRLSQDLKIGGTSDLDRFHIVITSDTEQSGTGLVPSYQMSVANHNDVTISGFEVIGAYAIGKVDTVPATSCVYFILNMDTKTVHNDLSEEEFLQKLESIGVRPPDVYRRPRDVCR